MISRRRFLGSAGAAILAAPLAAGAEQAGKVYKVGYLWAGSSPDTIAEGTTSFRSGERFEHALHDLGWVKGRNIAFEYRFGEGDFNRLPELATELVGLGLDVILAQAGPETNALKQATKRIPIVFGAHGDPVGSGDVQSLAHPGGNITGLALMHPELGGKQLVIETGCTAGVACGGRLERSKPLEGG
jgi:putative ABC transport system substrate-binding protein